MPRGRDPYEVLGLSPSACRAEVKRRYRELARQFHPDVAEDKGAAHARFVEIGQAYRVLSDPRTRAEHDRAQRPAPPHQAPQPEPRRGRSLLFVEAQALLAEGRHADAARLCERLAAERPDDPEVFCLMGDISAARGDPDGARLAYEQAIRLAPQRAAYRERLAGLSAKSQPEPPQPRGAGPQAAGARSAWPRAVGLGVGWGAVGAALIAARLVPGEPGALLGVPMRLVPLGLVAAALVGLLLCASGAIRSFGSEMIFTSVRGPAAGSVPLAALLVPSGVIFLGLALGVYLLIAAMEEHWSRSILMVFATSVVLTGCLAWCAGGAWRVVLTWGSGPGFACMCLGWALGDVFRGQWWD